MMSMKALVLGGVGAGCLAAAGLGSYLAVQGGSVDSAAAPVARPATEVTVQTAEAPAAVASRQARTTPSVQERPTATARPAERVQPPPARTDRPKETQTPPTVAESHPTPAERAPEPAGAITPTDPEPAQATSPAHEVAAPETPRAKFEELTVATNGVIGIRLETPVSSDTAKVEDRVTAKVARDVTVDGRVAVPAGSTFEGVVTEVERGGRFRERAKLGIRFTTIILPDNTRVNVTTEPIFRTAARRAQRSAAQLVRPAGPRPSWRPDQISSC
jgi:type IV secretory pathway VirB10-like protein